MLKNGLRACLVMAALFATANAGEEYMPMHPGPARARAVSETAGVSAGPLRRHSSTDTPIERRTQRAPLHKNAVTLQLPSLGAGASQTESRPVMVNAYSNASDGTLNFSSVGPDSLEIRSDIPGLVVPEVLAMDKYNFASPEPVSAGRGTYTPAPALQPLDFGYDAPFDVGDIFGDHAPVPAVAEIPVISSGSAAPAAGERARVDIGRPEAPAREYRDYQAQNHREEREYRRPSGRAYARIEIPAVAAHPAESDPQDYVTLPPPLARNEPVPRQMAAAAATHSLRPQQTAVSGSLRPPPSFGTEPSVRGEPEPAAVAVHAAPQSFLPESGLAEAPAPEVWTESIPGSGAVLSDDGDRRVRRRVAPPRSTPTPVRDLKNVLNPIYRTQ